MCQDIATDDLDLGRELDLESEGGRYAIYSCIFKTDSDKTAAIMLFESLVERLRTGNVRKLLQFFKCEEEDVQTILDSHDDLPVLMSGDWEYDIPSYYSLATDLEAMNL